MRLRPLSGHTISGTHALQLFILICFVKACHYTAWHVEGDVDSYTHSLHSHEEVCTHARTQTQKRQRNRDWFRQSGPTFKGNYMLFFKEIRRCFFLVIYTRDPLTMILAGTYCFMEYSNL